ncbi:MAG: hypothetical protein WBW70_08545, partial [Candidatus Sulfotelmatobacter sp.]
FVFDYIPDFTTSSSPPILRAHSSSRTISHATMIQRPPPAAHSASPNCLDEDLQVMFQEMF